MLSYFAYHSLPVNHLKSSCQNFAEKILRFDRYLQGTDDPSLVVIHRRSTLGCIYHCKLYSVKQKKSFIFMQICAAVLVHPFCTLGQWSQYDPVDEDGSRYY